MINSWNFKSKNFGLVLSGGGGKGAYQVGVLKYLSEIDFFDQGPSHISGVSVGSINASVLAQGSRSEFALSIKNLEKFWLEDVTCNDDILQFSFPKFIPRFWKPSLGESFRLEKILRKRINIENIRRSDIKIELGAIDVKSGDMKFFNNSDPFIFKGIMASCAYPFAFPPVKIENSFYIDGGVKNLTPLKRSVKHGVDNIICIGTGHNKNDLATMKIKNIFDIGRGLIRICSTDNLKKDIEKLVRINNQVEIYNPPGQRRPLGIMFFNPSECLGDTFDFSREKNIFRINLGYEDAKRILSFDLE